MIDLNYYNNKKKLLRKHIGMKNSPFDFKESYSSYFNSNGMMTGVKDNERNIFYEYRKQEDMEKFIDTLNIKEERNSNFLSVIELELKKFTDREIEYYEKIKELENKIEELEDDNRKYKYAEYYRNVKVI